MTEKIKKPYRVVTSAYIALIFSFFLLYFDENGLAAISKAKLNCYYTLTICYAAAVLLIFILQTIQRKLKIRQITADLKHTPVAAWLILLYLIFTVISACLSDFPTVWLGGNRREGVLTISLYCVSFLLICRFFRPERWMLGLFAAATTAFCIICVFQMCNVNIFGLYPLGRSKASCKDFICSFIGTIGNIDFTAGFLCIAIPVFWCSILRFKEKQCYLLFIPLLLSLAVLLKINVAAGYVGIIAGTLLSLPVVMPCRRKSRIVLLCCVVALCAAICTVLYFYDPSQKDLHQLHNVLHGKLEDSYGSGRIYIWRRTVHAVPAHLCFGTGPDTLSLMDFANINVVNKNNEILYVKTYDAAHNEYLTILFQQGFFALLSYLSALVISLVQWIRQARSSPVAAIAGAAVLCYALQAFFGISQLITAPYFWCIFAVLVAVLHDKKDFRSPKN